MSGDTATEKQRAALGLTAIQAAKLARAYFPMRAPRADETREPQQ